MRKDLSIYNEATGFVITSKGLNGRLKTPFSQATSDWNDEIARGTLIPITLAQDDSINVRVVLDEELSEAEREEAYDRFDAVLAVPDGKLLVVGGSEYTEEPGADYIEEYGRIVKVPAGNYTVTVLTYYHSPNVAIFEEDMPEYFSKTRRRKKMPRWIADEDDETNYISFVLHLRTRDRLGPNPIPLGDDGWVPEDVNKHRPARCPLGLVAKKLAGKRGEQKQVALIYRYRVFETMGDIVLQPVVGGPVAIPVKSVVLPHWIAWMAGETHPELCVTPDGDWSPEWPGFLNGIQETKIGDTWLIEIEGMNARWSPFGHLAIVGALLESLPDGSIVEAGWAGTEPDDEEEEDEEETEPTGIMRLRGHVLQGQWQIEEAFPSFDHTALRTLLAFAEEGQAAEGFVMRDEKERDDMIAHCRQHAFFFKKTPPVADGLRLRSADPTFNPFLAAHIFARRFDGVMPIMDWDD